MNLSINKCRGQCYDGASNMAGAKTGVSTQIKLEEPRAIFTHCYGHSLQLAVDDTTKGIKNLADMFNAAEILSQKGCHVRQN